MTFTSRKSTSIRSLILASVSATLLLNVASAQANITNPMNAQLTERVADSSSIQAIPVQSSCENWYYELQSKVESYNYRCSGSLSQGQYDDCQAEYSYIEQEIYSYNNSCGQ
jgi:hypothetical protein